MKQYTDLLRKALLEGQYTQDRTGVGTKSLFGYQMRFNLQEGFPAVTTKKLAWRSVVGELLWFLEGSTDERRLAEITFEADRTEVWEKKTIWTANADAQGVALGYRNDDLYKELGPVYGSQWRDFNNEGFDQIRYIIRQLTTEPDSRRIILSAWNPNQLEEMALPPCHTLAQFKVINGKLSCQLYQRSADMFLGVPFNIASYSLLTHMLAQICGLEVGDFVWTGGDCHLYLNHLDQAKEQISRAPLPLPKLKLDETISEIDAFTADSIEILNYEHHPHISAPISV